APGEVRPRVRRAVFGAHQPSERGLRLRLLGGGSADYGAGNSLTLRQTRLYATAAMLTSHYQEESVEVSTVRLTVAQALVRFLANQYSERDGVQQRLIPGCWGIFGHGNVAGVAQALLEAQTTGSADLPYYLARNEQGMVHAAVGYSRM